MYIHMEEATEARQHLPAELLLPFMVDAEAGQAGDGVPLKQLIQAYGTFSCILGQDVLCKAQTYQTSGGISGPHYSHIMDLLMTMNLLVPCKSSMYLYEFWLLFQ